MCTSRRINSDSGQRHSRQPSGRRHFLKLALLGAGAALYGVVQPAAPAVAAGDTEALLLSCMDFRLMDDIVRYMDGRGLTNKYDHVILAGASLGVFAEKYPAWGKTFWEHVEVAKELHHIKKLIVIDHRDCGAYKVLLGPDHMKTPAAERDAHAQQLKKLQAMIKEKHPQLAVELLLMSLDGQVETIT